MRKIVVQIACVISIATVANYSIAGMMKGSHLGWLYLCHERTLSCTPRTYIVSMGEGMMQTIITVVTALGSAGAWQFYQSRMKLKHVERTEDRSEQTMFRDDLRERGLCWSRS